MKKIIDTLRKKDTEMAMKVNKGLFRKHKKGASQFVEVLIVVLIAVIVGAALLAIMKTAMPDLFEDIIDKIKTVFEL